MPIVRTIPLAVHLCIATTYFRAHAHEAKGEHPYNPSTNPTPPFTFYKDPKGISYRGPRGYPFPATSGEEDVHPSSVDSIPPFTFHRGARGYPSSVHPMPSFTYTHPFPVVVGERAYTLEEYEGTLSTRTRRAYTFTASGRAYTFEEYEEMQWMGDTELTCKPLPSFKEACCKEPPYSAMEIRTQEFLLSTDFGSPMPSFKEPMPSFKEDEVQMDRYREAFPLGTCNSPRDL